MPEIVKGADVAKKLKDQIRNVIAKEQVKPCLGIVRVGEKGSDLAYENGVRKTCESVGIDLKVFAFPEEILQYDLEKEFDKINKDPSIHGILFFKPLPGHLDSKTFDQMIDPAKDMDCMNPVNHARLYAGEKNGYFPCTAEAVIRMIEYAGKDTDGANAVVLGRSSVIGKPLGLMLLAKNATVTWCHTHTKDMAERCRNADILVSACGVSNIVGKEIASQVAPGCMFVDVGMNFTDGKMCGDFNFDEVLEYAGYITPVPGGVGSVTNTVMASHVVRAAVLKEKGKVISF